MKARLIALVLCVLAVGSSPAQAEKRFIVRTNTGLKALENVCRIVRCNVLRGIEDPESELFVISSANVGLLSVIRNNVLSIELDEPVPLFETASDTPPPAGSDQIPEGLSDRRLVKLNGDDVWKGYYNQPAANIVRVQEAQRQFKVQGSGTVAVIDTGIDPNHPVLKSVIVPGYDFTRGESGPGSEMADVNQSTAAVVDGTPVRVNGTTFAVVNQSTAAVVDGGGHSAFGHGTMVAGIIHLVAPRATIMSLKAFGSNGFGYTSDVVRAVYYAVRTNASAINMSFSIPESSRELAKAVTFAVNRGVVCVASAGNSGTTSVVYPAGFNKVMAIASTDINDKRSSFSNYGEKYIWVAAPGEGIITTYPFSTYAAGWGTSFSTPFVTGTAALLMDVEPNTNQGTAAKRIAHAQQLERDLGNGRLDVVRALKSASARQ
jgi:subtilisin family serine protease